MNNTLVVTLRTWFHLALSVVFLSIWGAILVALSPWRSARCWWIARGSRGWMRVLGIRIKVHNPQHLLPHGGMVVANHGNFFDPLILGGLFPKAFPVSKAEVATIPMFGWVAKQMDAIFIDRSTRSLKERKQQAAQVAARLAEGPVIVFAEATRTGFHPATMQPFRRMLVAPVVNSGKPLIPVTLALVEPDRTRFASMPSATTGKDESMLANIKRWAGHGVTVHVIAHPPRYLTDENWAAQLKAAETEVRQGLSDTLGIPPVAAAAE